MIEMKRIITIILVISIGLLFHSCELDTGENFHFVSLEITEADVPDVFVLDQSHMIPITFVIPDDCTFFQGFDVFDEGNGQVTITVVGAVLIEEEDCSLLQEFVTETLTINANNVESYTLRFYTGEDEEENAQYLEYVVPVVDGMEE